MFSTLSGKQILVLEPEPIIALNLVLALEQIGATALPASTVRRARELLDLRRVVAAVLDVNASDEAKAFCDVLRERRIPFIIHGNGGPTPPGAAEVIAKPARASTVAANLALALQGLANGATRAVDAPRRRSSSIGART